MNGDVPRIGSDDTLVPGQQSRNDHGVSLGAAREEEHVGGLVIASRADAGRHTFAKAVAAIARRGSRFVAASASRMRGWAPVE